MIQLPKIDHKYWILMVLATTIGEIVGNLISRNLELGYSIGSLLLTSIYLFSLSAIIISKKQSNLVYWILIVLGNIAGTNYADFITIEPLKLGTIYGSLLVMAILICTLRIWKITAPKSSVKDKLSNSLFYLYWFAILMSSTFGTTSGDFLSNDTSLGAGGGTLLLIGFVLVIFILENYKLVSVEISYWLILIIMHPIGATIGNYISKPAGLNLGNIWTGLVLISLFSFVFFSNKYSSITGQKSIQDEKSGDTSNEI